MLGIGQSVQSLYYVVRKPVDYCSQATETQGNKDFQVNRTEQGSAINRYSDSIWDGPSFWMIHKRERENWRALQIHLRADRNTKNLDCSMTWPAACVLFPVGLNLRWSLERFQALIKLCRLFPKAGKYEKMLLNNRNLPWLWATVLKSSYGLWTDPPSVYCLFLWNLNWPHLQMVWQIRFKNSLATHLGATPA